MNDFSETGEEMAYLQQEFQKLQSENAQLKTENEKLRMSHSKMMQLSREFGDTEAEERGVREMAEIAKDLYRQARLGDFSGLGLVKLWRESKGKT